MKKGEHLPMYGVGSIYVYVIAAMTLAAVLMRDLPVFAFGRLERAHTLLLALGILLIVAGVALWVYAVPGSKIDDGIRENRLVTTGAYALVRNPIYSAVMIACTGVLLTKSCGVLLFTAILLGCALIAGAKIFWQGFGLAFGLMAWIGVYDTCFLDWVLFANLPMFRLGGTEHMDKAYHQKWFHAKGMLFPGIVFAVLPAALVGLLVM